MWTLLFLFYQDLPWTSVSVSCSTASCRPPCTFLAEFGLQKRNPSWSPNSTDLYFWYLFVVCQQTNTKDIAGQSAKKPTQPMWQILSMEKSCVAIGKAFWICKRQMCRSSFSLYQTFIPAVCSLPKQKKQKQLQSHPLQSIQLFAQQQLETERNVLKNQKNV